MAPMQHPLAEEWTPVDSSKTHLELAMTEGVTETGEPIIALRDSFDRTSGPVFAPRSHIIELAKGYADGRLARLLGR